MEGIAAKYGLILEWGNSVHLLDSQKTGIASVHTVGFENDLTVNPKYELAQELFGALSEALFGVSPEGPLAWRTISDG